MELNKSLVHEIQVEWNKAEKAIKSAENVAKDVAIPSVKELRYAGRRLIDALDKANTDNTDPKVQALLEDARFCCHRAQHDAIDVIFAKINIDLDNLTSKLGFGPVQDAFPDFNSFFGEFQTAHEKIVESRGDRENRNKIYDTISTIDLPNITKKYNSLMAVRPIAKSYARQKFFGSIYGFIIAICSILAAIFAGLSVDWDKYI